MKHVCKIFFVTIALAVVTSCSYFKDEDNKDAVVQLDEYVITNDELKKLLPEGYTKEDSTRIVTDYINQWATDRLLYNRAKENISLKDQTQLENLIEQYRIELYAQMFMRDLTLQKLDTALNDKAIQKYYEGHKQEFKLNEEIVRFKYIHLSNTVNNISQAEKLFNSNTDQAINDLDSLSTDFKSSMLNDQAWNRKSTFMQRIESINSENVDSYLVSGKYSKIQDSLGVYLIRVREVLRRGDIAPLPFVKPTVKEILINRKKLQYMRELEKELLNDAIENDKLKIKN